MESHACGTPVVSFDVGGLSDIVDHHITGSLVKELDHKAMAKEITWLVEDEYRHKLICEAARKKAIDLWSEERISKMYADFYFRILNR